LPSGGRRGPQRIIAAPGVFATFVVDADKMTRLHVLLAASLAASAALGLIDRPVHAATLAEEKKACRDDAFHYCAVDIPVRKRIAACLKRHIDELSPACRAMFEDDQPTSAASGASAAPASGAPGATGAAPASQ
jgi:hypothetical protein